MKWKIIKTFWFCTSVAFGVFSENVVRSVNGCGGIERSETGSVLLSAVGIKIKKIKVFNAKITCWVD